jgi:hypothetical protein
MNDSKDVKTFNAVQCRICGANADLLQCGIYVCQENPAHCGDTFVGIFTDLTYPEKKKR